MFSVPTSPLARRAVQFAAIFGLTATLAACTTEGVLRPQASLGIDNVRTAAYLPRGINPLTWDQEQQDVMPAEEVACRKRLKKLDVAYNDIPQISEGSGCGIAWPVQLTSVDGVHLQNGATLNCSMAEAFARWVKKELVPTTRWRYFSGVKSIQMASTYSCRWIKGRVGGTLSEHGKGNAVDIGSITLNNGREIDVRKPGFFAFREKAVLKKARAEACDYFTTVLGPGYDYDHRDHFHFDLKERRNGHVACN